VVDAPDLLGEHRVRAGDAVVAMASSGLHANGFSLVRHVLQRAGWDVHRHVDELGRTLGEELLEPTRIYARDCLALARDPALDLHALAHVTGGGLSANVARVLPGDVSARLERGSWTPPAVFALVADVGGVERAELEATLNMGVGMVAVLPAERADEAVRALRARGVPAWAVGELHAAAGVDGSRVELVGDYAG